MRTLQAIKLEKGQLIMSFCLQDKLNCSIFGHGVKVGPGPQDRDLGTPPQSLKVGSTTPFKV